ncbi:hypothetical protein EV714DRAFT_238268 [Schizophyllum commune]
MRRLAPPLLALSTLLAVQVYAKDVTLHYVAEEVTDSHQRPSYAQSRSYSIVPIGTADDDSVTTYSVELAVSLKAWVDESTTSSVTDDPVQTETFTLVEGASTMGYDDINTQVVTSTLTDANGQPTGTTTDSWAAGVSEACQFDADAGIGSCVMHLAYDTGLESHGVTFTGSLAPFYTLSTDDNGAGATRGLPASLTALCSVAAGVGLGVWITVAHAS